MEANIDSKIKVFDGEKNQLEKIILENWNQLSDIHLETKKETMEQRPNNSLASVINDRAWPRRFDYLFINIMTNQGADCYLRYVNPKIYQRMEGHIRTAKKEFSRLVRRHKRIPLARLLKRVGVDPKGPYPRNLVDKSGRSFS